MGKASTIPFVLILLSITIISLFDIGIEQNQFLRTFVFLTAGGDPCER
jgi:hypothetical protein